MCAGSYFGKPQKISRITPVTIVSVIIATNEYVVIAKSRPDCRNPRRLAIQINTSTPMVISKW
jgi:hypothetical protein